MTWKIGHFYKKSGKTWNSQGTFKNFYPSQGKVKENKIFSLHIIFINYWHSCPQSRCSLLPVNVNFILYNTRNDGQGKSGYF